MSRVAWVPSPMPLQVQLLHTEQVSSRKRCGSHSPTLTIGLAAAKNSLRFREIPELLMNKGSPESELYTSEGQWQPTVVRCL